MQKLKPFNLDKVFVSLLEGTFENRMTLLDRISKDMRQSRNFKQFLAEVAGHSLEQRTAPIDTLGLCIAYGVMVGLTLAKEEEEDAR